MKCNLPGNYKTEDRYSRETFNDCPVRYNHGEKPQIGRVNLSRGFASHSMMGHGTGKRDSFTKRAGSRRTVAQAKHKEAMRDSRLRESERFIQRHQPDESVM